MVNMFSADRDSMMIFYNVLVIEKKLVDDPCSLKSLDLRFMFRSFVRWFEYYDVRKDP